MSTLRRRIKAEDIQYRFDEGKYMIMEDESADEHRPSLRSDVQPKSASLHTQNTQQQDAGESVITAANRLLTDLKKAYTQVLQEKETQIQGLRQELADIKTLVKVLESENTRLRN
ncbi:MAG: hypothetical protein H7328_10030 [Bdellovibrio sp.]|nr:hypothetical protein [Bdellovibrio sp.]